MSTFIKAERVVSTALGLLLREITLPQFVWRDSVGDFAGAKNDTISIRLPAYAPARTRALRSGAVRTRDELFERKIDVTLDTDVYKFVGFSDEQLTLDIADFGSQVLNPITLGVAQALEQEVANTISGATYQHNLTYTAGTDDVYTDIVLPARALLNGSYVPQDGRVLLVGSDLEQAFLSHSKFIDNSFEQTVRNGVVGRVAGFGEVVSSPVIAPNEAYAYHRTAYIMSQRAPIIPAGAPWGASSAYQGLAMRFVRSYDAVEVEDLLIADSWVGSNVVTDHGHYDADPAAGGRFVPVEDPANPITGNVAPNTWMNDEERLVRSVKITAA